MALTYGMIADRLSDLVAELTEYANETTDYHKASELANIVTYLDTLRDHCDAQSMKVN